MFEATDFVARGPWFPRFTGSLGPSFHVCSRFLSLSSFQSRSTPRDVTDTPVVFVSETVMVVLPSITSELNVVIGLFPYRIELLNISVMAFRAHRNHFSVIILRCNLFIYSNRCDFYDVRSIGVCGELAGLSATPFISITKYLLSLLIGGLGRSLKELCMLLLHSNMFFLPEERVG